VRVHERRVEVLKSEEPAQCPVQSLWIYRYYEETSQAFGSGKRVDIENLGRDLGALVDYVIAKTGAPKVHLVAHSMGGLICRSLMQLSLKQKAADKIARFFTYATPHGGIHFRTGLGWAAAVRDFLGVNDSDNFGERRMRQFLNLPNRRDPLNSIGRHFNPRNVFSLVGTNWEDYTVRTAKLGVGPGSDGLVQIEHAHVKGSNRAFVHRAHSGPCGIVNSEEGYQNLQRFLFGDTAVRISLAGVEVAQSAKTGPRGAKLSNLVLETSVALRGGKVHLSRQLQDHGSQHQVDPARLRGGEETLFRTFLMKGNRPSGREHYSQFVIRLRVIPIYTRERRLAWDRHYAEECLFEETVYIGVGDPGPDQVRKFKYGWGTMDQEMGPPIDTAGDCGTHRVPLPLGQSQITAGELRFEITPW